PVGYCRRGRAAAAVTRASVARRTLPGAVAAVLTGTEEVAAAAAAQATAAEELARTAEGRYADAVRAVMDSTEDGTLLRGEVLARRQEFVGTGEWLRGAEAAVGRPRDRGTRLLRGRPTTPARARGARGGGLGTP